MSPINRLGRQSIFEEFDRVRYIVRMSEIFDSERDCPYDVGIGVYDQAIEASHQPAPEHAAPNRLFWKNPMNILTGAIAAVALFAVAKPTVTTIIEGFNVATANTEETCQAPSPKSIREVQKLFAAPTPVGISKQPADYGLTYHDSYGVLTSIVAADTSTSTGFRKMLGTANRSLARYGVEISVIGNDEAKKEEKKVPDTALLTDDDTRSDIRYIVEGTMDLPVEYVAYSGVKRVVLYHGSATDEIKAYVHVTDGNTRDKQTVYYELSDVADDSTTPHEIYHKVDRKECGSYMAMEDDPAFATITSKNIAKKDRTKVKSLDEFQRDESDVQRLIDEATYRDDRKSYCRLVSQQHAAEKWVVNASDYSFKNSKEDKAVMGEILARPDLFKDYLNPKRPVLKQKFELLLARLHDKMPKFVEYLASVSTRPLPEGPKARC